MKGKRMKKSLWIAILIIVLVVIVGFLWWRQYVNERTMDKGGMINEEAIKLNNKTVAETGVIAAADETMTAGATDSGVMTEGGGTTDIEANTPGVVEVEEDLSEEIDESAMPPVVTKSGMIAGTLVEATMNNIVVERANGQRMSFSTMEAEMKTGEKGLVLGEVVAVFYDDKKPLGENYWAAEVVQVVKE